MIVYITSHRCGRDEVKSDRYWVVDGPRKKLIHIGVCDVDISFMNMLIDTLGSSVFKVSIPDEEFKKLMIAEGYTQ